MATLTLLGWLQERQDYSRAAPGLPETKGPTDGSLGSQTAVRSDDDQPVTKVRADDHAAPLTAVRQDDRSHGQLTFGPEETRVRQDD
jgi:hypothetical protein